MPWNPTQTLLTTTDELKNLSFTISYTQDPLVSLTPATVTVTAVTPTPYIQVNAATISGYYSDTFNYSVKYIDNINNKYTVSKFNDIDSTKLSQLYDYIPSMVESVTYYYTAVAKDSITSAVLATQTYSIVVTQNWSPNKNLLKRYVNFKNYLATTVVVLTNLDGNVVQTLNNSGTPIYLEKD
jgi:hypothetical protein